MKTVTAKYKEAFVRLSVRRKKKKKREGEAVNTKAGDLQ